jgi:hypothetical protein
MLNFIQKIKDLVGQQHSDDAERFLTIEETNDEIEAKFVALELENAKEQEKLTKEKERETLANKLREEAILRRQLLSQGNIEALTSSLDLLVSNNTLDPNVQELKALFNTLEVVRNCNSHTAESMQKIFAEYQQSVEATPKVSIDDKLNSLFTGENTNPVTSIDQAMVTAFESSNSEDKEELAQLKKSMGL